MSCLTLNDATDQCLKDYSHLVEGIFPAEDAQRFLDRQGRVHARVGWDIGQEFGVYLSVPLSRDAQA